MKGRFVFASSMDIKCANRECGRTPENVGEGGWLEFVGEFVRGSKSYHCPLCAQTYGVKWHYRENDNFVIENLPPRSDQ